MISLERLSKSAALTSALLIVALQITLHPDATPFFRTVATLALIVGWLAARPSRQTIHAAWIFIAPLSPAVLRWLTGREGPILDVIWMAGLTGALARSVPWGRWMLPAGWRVLLGGWALALSLAWPILVAREANFTLQGLTDFGAINSWAMLSAPQVIAWMLHVVLTQLLGLVWLDWVVQRFREHPTRVPLAVHSVWVAGSVASLVALYQGTIDLGFLSSAPWPDLRRATGTMLDANAYGVLAALAGPIAFVAVRRWETSRRLLIAGGVLMLNLAGMWMSGSRTATLCGAAGLVGLVSGTWTGHGRRAKRVAVGVAGAAVLGTTVLALFGAAIGPLGRLFELPPGETRMLATLVDRGGYGTVAMRILRELPLTGVGVGSFHVIAPDYWRVMTNEALPFDNAQNWWRHQLAELGLLGGLALLLWSAVVAVRVMTSGCRPGERHTAMTVRGLVAGVGVCCLLGIPTQNPAVLLAFLLLLGWLTVLLTNVDVVATESAAAGTVALSPSTLERRPPWLQPMWVVVTALAVAYAGAHLLLARGRLSVEARAVRSGRPYVTGAYPPEPLPGSNEFRWTGKEAHFLWPAPTRWLVIRLWTDHPDVATDPVHVTLSTPCGVLLDRDFGSPSPVSVGVEFPEGLRTVSATVRVSRTWQPGSFAPAGQGADARDLGAGIVAEFVPTKRQAEEVQVPVRLPACGGML